jgi:hypothetical protein
VGIIVDLPKKWSQVKGQLFVRHRVLGRIAALIFARLCPAATQHLRLEKLLHYLDGFDYGVDQTAGCRHAFYDFSGADQALCDGSFVRMRLLSFYNRFFDLVLGISGHILIEHFGFNKQ